MNEIKLSEITKCILIDVTDSFCNFLEMYSLEGFGEVFSVFLHHNLDHKWIIEYTVHDRNAGF